MKVTAGKFRTYTGKEFDLINPIKEDIDIIDIARSLAFQCHFGGHVTDFFSIAQHCIYVLEAYESECNKYDRKPDLLLMKACLLHDSTEAYIGDMIKPLKVLLPDYKMIEDKLQHAIFEKFDIPIKYLSMVKPYDLSIQFLEYNTFQSNDLYNKCTEFWKPQDAEIEFLDCFNRLFLTNH